MSVAIAPKLEERVEARGQFATTRPITFDQFLRRSGPKDHVELLDGVAVTRVAAELDHERLLVFLSTLLTMFAEDCQAGQILGSRTAVRISEFRGRLPDLLFVRQENVARLEQKGLPFAPDLVIEVISPGDGPADIHALETDYRNIGVPEIVFIDQRKRTVRVLDKCSPTDADDREYASSTFGPGQSFRLRCLNDVLLPVDWLFDKSRPSVRAALAQWNVA